MLLADGAGLLRMIAEAGGGGTGEAEKLMQLLGGRAEGEEAVWAGTCSGTSFRHLLPRVPSIFPRHIATTY
jgi:hypothetical protein